MTRRTLWLTGALALVLGVGVVGVQQCRWEPIDDFSYASHERPRVFVSHHPLIPRPSTTLLVRLSPDLPADVSVSAAKATLSDTNGAAIETRDCAPTGDIFECQFNLPSTAPVLVYGGRLELSNGTSVSSRTTYRFTVAPALPDNRVLEVRVPVAPVRSLAETYRVDTALARDPDGYPIESFVGDVELALYQGVLRDPAYRWRDDQLGFYVYSRHALVTSYYSGRDTRCGKNPWPRDESFPTELTGIETLGVLHRKTATTDGLEGRVTAPVGADVFRDCAGQAVKQDGVGTFSATAGLAESALIATHEFGHAAFGEGDEYTEDQATRNVPPAPAFPPGECCCVDDTSSGGSGGGGPVVVVPTPRVGVQPQPPRVAMMNCLAPDGSIQPRVLSGSPPACGTNNSGIPDRCFSGPDGGCPPLAGDCVAASHWLGPTASRATPRPNVFTTRSACLAAATLAADHPGVEDPTRSLATCRQVCGGSMAACPCGVTESWIVDRDPATTTRVVDDLMGRAARAALHGGTCIWCVETSLCVRWQRALGENADEVWRACEAPPKEATQFERWTRGIATAIGRIVDQLLRAITF
jgi:hypothetical protein